MSITPQASSAADSNNNPDPINTSFAYAKALAGNKTSCHGHFLNSQLIRINEHFIPLFCFLFLLFYFCSSFAANSLRLIIPSTRRWGLSFTLLWRAQLHICIFVRTYLCFSVFSFIFKPTVVHFNATKNHRRNVLAMAAAAGTR